MDDCNGRSYPPSAFGCRLRRGQFRRDVRLWAWSDRKAPVKKGEHTSKIKRGLKDGRASLPPEVFRVPLGVFFPLFRKVVERKNGRHRADRNAGAAVNAFYGINVEHLLGAELLRVFLGMNAIHRTGVDTGGVFGSNAGLGNYVGHKICCSLVCSPEGE
jgi:hypothetical protein